ncbi:protein NLRC5-like isoform X2 [Pseudorasbora parva]
MEKFKKILQKQDTECFVKDFNENRCSIKEAALDITLYFLRAMKQDEAADSLEDELVFVHPLKCSLRKKYKCVFEGIAKHGDSTLLNNIYTDLYVTQGGSEQVNTEHEVRQIEVASRHHESQEIQVECKNLFEAPEQDKEIRTVLTKGVAGIGKSISVQKFILDWAEGKENQDISLIFPLPFRELNLKEKGRQNLIDLISQFFPETRQLNLTRRNQFKILFILDGLDECRLPLNFNRNEMWQDVSSPASLDVLLTNLIKGNLLPSALIWITTRPAAASKIPPDYIDKVTEVRGFNDAQKEEYFRKRFTDKNQAKKIIDHIKKSKSLFIMCHIPVFCWISATVLQNILEEKRNNDLKNNQADDASKTLQESTTEDTPKTLTQMYTHYLRFQIQQSRQKYDGQYASDISWDKDAILSLGKLAFHELQRNNLIFYDTDLEACGIDVYKASVYSGMCTQIFKEETGIILGTMYCFVHFSIQEFIAALYAHLFLDNNKKSVFIHESTEQENKNETMIDLLKTAVDKALESDNGHLDLFLRFLLGLSLQSNRLLVRGLLIQQDDNDQSKKEIVQYIKQKLEDNLSPERSINLFYCLNELNDQTLVKEIQNHLSKRSLSSADLSPAQWSALAFVLLTSEEELEEFELQKFKKSDECLIRLSALLKTSKKALLNDCNLTDKSCSALSIVLGSDTNLKELNVSNNNLLDSGVKLLCTGLKSANCKLEILRLSNCSITEEGYKALASALRSNPSHLLELDVTGNDPGQSGVKLLNDILQDPNCQLTRLRFLGSTADEACQYVNGVVGKNPLFLRKLNLSGHNLGESNMKRLVPLLQDKHCTLNTLILSDCSINEEGYKAIASALRSNPSHLIELDLTGNYPGQSGVKELDDLLQDERYKLKIIRFLKSPAAQEACDYLTGILSKSPLLLTELDLSEDKLGDLDGKKLSALLMDSHCKVEKIKLNNCELTEKGCSVLATVLSSKTILKELNLNNSRLLDSGVKEICGGLKNPVCELKILKLSNCSITEEGYKALASALRSNPSHLIELDLTGNDPGQSGVKQLNDLLHDPNCQLRTLRFLGPNADEACQYVIKVVGKNPLLLRELNLSDHELGDTQVNQIAALLQDKHCKLNTLMLCNCGLTEESCSALATVLRSNSSLKELDISNNNLQDSGVKKLQNGLENTNCTLEKLRLSNCNITEEGYKALASSLRSNPSHLIELDLTGNDPGQSGVKELSDLLQDPNCQLKILRFLSPDADTASQFVRGLVSKNLLLLTELNLSEHKLGDSNVKKLAVLLQDKHCKLITLTLRDCDLTGESCSALATVLRLNSSLKELDISNNNLQDSGVKKLQNGLEKTNCTLEKLRLSNCSITEEGYKGLASALRSNPSHLIELDLTGNDPGQSGVKELNDLLQDPKCQLKTLRILSHAADEACQYVREIVSNNPLLLRELNLSDRELGDARVNQIAVLLRDKHCKLNTLQLCNCGLTEESCSTLATVLRSNSSLKDLDISNNNLQDSGVKKLRDGLENTNCTLQKLKLSNCSITEEGYKALASALRSNPSHLIELDLRGNDPGQSGVKEIDDLLEDPNCQLKTLRFLGPDADEACQCVRGIVGKNPLLLRELNLSECELGDSGVNQIAVLLQDKHCKLNTLMLRNCGLTEESCSALATVLRSNSSLKELDISNNNLQDSGVKKLQNSLGNTNCTLKKLILSNCNITEEGYKALASALRSNPSHLIELDLTGNDPGQSGVKLLSDLLEDPNCQLKILRFLNPDADEACQFVRGLVGKNLLLLRELNLSEHILGDSNVKKLAVLLQDKHCKLITLALRDCDLIPESCSALATVLRSNSSLKELDISNNNLQDSGVKKLQNGLENTNCALEKLRLSDCSITEEGYKALASALRSNPSHLIELDLTGNDPGQSGVKLLNDLLQDPNCQLKTLRILSPAADEACQYVTGIVGKNLLLLRELNLSDHELGDTRVNQIAALLQDKHCKLNTLQLCNCGLTEESCSALATVLSSNSSLKELDISNNNLQDSGVKKLCDGLENTNCTLQKLKLSNCSITEEGYKALASALRSNPSHLIELDLRGNDPGQSGVKELDDLLEDPNCQLTTLRFLGPDADEACHYVRGIVGKNPLLLRELNLSECELGDSGVNQISVLLQDKHCRPNTLMLCNCGLTDESCSTLATVLRSNSSLKELNISNNNLQDSGVKKLQNGLENTNCTLKKLRLANCRITEEGYKALASALRSKLSHLIELDLTGNDPGQSGVKELSDLLEDPNCQLKTLRLLGPAADEACHYVKRVMGKNPLSLNEVNLSLHELGDARVNQISALLQDKHCKLNTLNLWNCSITENQCLILTSALKSNQSHLRELDLSGNQIKSTGVDHLCDVLKDSHCKLERLRLSCCNLTDEGCSAVTSALKSNPSHLRELDLGGNKLGDSGVKTLCDLLMNPQSKLENLHLYECSITEKQCLILTSALKSNPSHLRELDLNGNQIRNTGVKHLCDILKDSHCKLERLKLRYCGMTDEGCSAVTSALKSNPSHLRELNLSMNELGDSGVKNLSDLLMNPQCKLEKLDLIECSVTEKQCLILTSALKSNPSHLRELDLSGNQIRNTGVKHLCDILKDSHCKLERLSLKYCGITDVSSLTQCLMNSKALQFLKELDLKNNTIGNSKQLRDVIRDSNCELRLDSEPTALGASSSRVGRRFTSWFKS